MSNELKHITVEEIARDTAGFIERAAREAQPVIIEKDGRAILAAVSPADLERWMQREREREEQFSIFDEIAARNTDKTTEEIERDVAEVIEEMRQEQRAAGVPPTAP